MLPPECSLRHSYCQYAYHPDVSFTCRFVLVHKTNRKSVSGQSLERQRATLQLQCISNSLGFTCSLCYYYYLLLLLFVIIIICYYYYLLLLLFVIIIMIARQATYI